MKDTYLSVVIPACNEQECIPLLYQRLCTVLEKISCKTEILFVNDGSTDDTLLCIQRLQQHDVRIAYIDLSRNFGKQAAISAGIDYMRGGMFSRKAIEALRQLPERERNMKGLFSFIGFRKKCIYYEQEPRAAGKTKWNYFQLFSLAIKGWTSFSVIPLRIISFTGVTVSFIAFIYLL